MNSRVKVSGFFKLPVFLKVILGGILLVSELYIISDLISSYQKGIFTSGDVLTIVINMIVLFISVKLLLDGLTPAFLEVNDKFILFKKYSFLPVRKVSYKNLERIYKTENSINIEIKNKSKVIFPLEIFNNDSKDKISAFVTIANQKLAFYRN